MNPLPTLPRNTGGGRKTVVKNLGSPGRDGQREPAEDEEHPALLELLRWRRPRQLPTPPHQPPPPPASFAGCSSCSGLTGAASSSASSCCSRPCPPNCSPRSC